MQALPRKKQLARADLVCAVDEVGLNLQIVEKEIGWLGAVGLNAAHLCCGNEDHIRFFVLQKGVGSSGITQVKFCMAASD